MSFGINFLNRWTSPAGTTKYGPEHSCGKDPAAGCDKQFPAGPCCRSICSKLIHGNFNRLEEFMHLSNLHKFALRTHEASVEVSSGLAS